MLADGMIVATAKGIFGSPGGQFFNQATSVSRRCERGRMSLIGTKRTCRDACHCPLSEMKRTSISATIAIDPSGAGSPLCVRARTPCLQIALARFPSPSG